MFDAFDDGDVVSMETEIQQLKRKVSTYEKQKDELEEAVVALNIKFRGSTCDNECACNCVVVLIFVPLFWMLQV